MSAPPVGTAAEDESPPIGLEARYTAAWDEIHVRSEARQNIRIQFAVVAVGSAVAALANLARPDWVLAWTFGFALAMPFLTWAFALWTRHADLTIGLLSRYCEACERVNDVANMSGMPSFHRRDQGWITEARRLGRLSDGADILLVLLTAFPAAALAIEVFGPASTAPWVPRWTPPTLLVAQLSAVPFIWRKRRQRAQIAELDFRLQADGWRLTRQ